MMWIFTDKGFLSIVQHKDFPDFFQVKSRTRSPLEMLWPEHDVEVIDWADYRFRISIRKDMVTPVLVGLLEEVLYTSFKNECHDDLEYYYALCRIWTTMYNFQAKMERT